MAATVAADRQISSSVLRSTQIGVDLQAYAAILASIAALSSNGIIARTASGTVAARTITAGSGSLTVTNGDGVSGNPTIDTIQDIRTTASPQWAAIGVGTASTSTAAIIASRNVTDPVATQFLMNLTSTANTITANNSQILVGISSDMRINQAGSNMTATTGVRAVNSAAYSSGSSGTTTGVAGGVFQGGNIGAGTLDKFYGALVTATLNSGGGTLNENNAFQVDPQTAGTLITAFRGRVASGTGRWNLYCDGTANNHVNGNLLIGTTTVPSGATFNHILGGGSTSPVLGAATADMVSQGGIDNGAGNREWQCQPEAGGFLAWGNDRLRRVPSANHNAEDGIVRTTTTNGTQTTIQTVPIPTDTTVMIEMRFIGRRTGGSAGTAGDYASYARRGTYTNISGTVTCRDAGAVPQVIGTDVEAQAGFDATMTISTTNVLGRVTGATNNNISWSVETKVHVITG